MTATMREFMRLVHDRRGHVAMRMTWQLKRYYKLRHRKGLPIGEHTARKYLINAGICIDDSGYTDSDLLEAVKFAINVNKETKSMGAAFVIEQWKAARMTKMSF